MGKMNLNKVLSSPQAYNWLAQFSKAIAVPGSGAERMGEAAQQITAAQIEQEARKKAEKKAKSKSKTSNLISAGLGIVAAPFTGGASLLPAAGNLASAFTGGGGSAAPSVPAVPLWGGGGGGSAATPEQLSNPVIAPDYKYNPSGAAVRTPTMPLPTTTSAAPVYVPGQDPVEDAKRKLRIIRSY